jgi:hypothetical protein
VQRDALRPLLGSARERAVARHAHGIVAGPDRRRSAGIAEPARLAFERDSATEGRRIDRLDELLGTPAARSFGGALAADARSLRLV